MIFAVLKCWSTLSASSETRAKAKPTKSDTLDSCGSNQGGHLSIATSYSAQTLDHEGRQALSPGINPTITREGLGGDGGKH